MNVLKKSFLYLDIVWMTLIIINNLSTIVIVLCHKNLRSIINDFLLSLFTSNLLYGFSVVFNVTAHFNQNLSKEYKYFCLIHFTVSLIPALGILYSLTAITADRYIAIFYPLRYLSIMNPLTVKTATFGIWTLSIATGCVPILWNNSSEFINGRMQCSFSKIIPDIFIWTFVIPPALTTIIVILFTYLKILCLQHQKRRKIACVPNVIIFDKNFEGDSKSTMTVTIIIFSSIFAIAPFFVVAVLVKAKVMVAPWLSLVAYEISFINPMFTPVIFAWRTESFREVIEKLLKRNLFCRSSVIRRRRSEITEISTLASSAVFLDQSMTV